MTVPKQEPRKRPRKPKECAKSIYGQHRFAGFPHSTARCIFCNMTREEADA